MRSRDDDKRKRILDSTCQIMMEQGIAAVTLSKIAKSADVSSGTVYTYFSDKDDILREAYLDRKAKLAEAINAVDLSGNPKLALEILMDAIYHYGKNHLDDMLIIREFNQSALLKQLNISLDESYSEFESLNQLTNRGIEEGVFVAGAYPVIMSYAYTPILEYLIAVRNNVLDPKKVPFDKVKEISLRAITK
ncbi:TetR/AcrR family transcriptional regulator [Pediococcus argentinicus]|nr:TetR/AcrR family transcriptional regulator [Pediococcus argentinicus]NKZ23156.1 TetR/AcrR family transcriptional regulator [Pediococcus argentinicus]GEP20334.1 hypothetical protein LSA03_17180 [Pediococcus argentinicus]